MSTLYEAILKYNHSQVNAIYFENKKISFQKMLINVRKMVSYLKAKGIKKKDVVTIVLPNIPTTIYLFYALDALGAIQNIVHPLTPVKQIIKTMEETNSQFAIVLATEYEKNKALFDQSPFCFFFANPMQDHSFLMRNMFYVKFEKVKENHHLFLLDSFITYPEEKEILARDAKEDSIYLHSGGTTGTPKIIALSDDALNHLAAKVDGILHCKAKGKSMLAVLPSFHGFGLGMGIHAPLYNEASTAIMMKFNSKKIIRLINQGKINMIIGVPLLYQKLMKDPAFLKAKLKNLEFCFIGGDNVPPSLIAQYNQMMKEHQSSCMLLEGYGLTETVTVCTVNTKQDFKMGSVGKPLQGIEMKILDENMHELLPNEVGEVYVRGDTLMNGYLKDEDATKKTMILYQQEPFIKTGDLGYLDEDGFLFLKGRKKRMFIISGINVYPSEIEKIATDNEAVYDAAMELFLTPKPHMVLFLIRNKNSLKQDEQIANEVMASLKEKVLKYSLPQQIVFLDEFPKTNVGKINHQGFIDPCQ